MKYKNRNTRKSIKQHTTQEHCEEQNKNEKKRVKSKMIKQDKTTKIHLHAFQS